MRCYKSPYLYHSFQHKTEKQPKMHCNFHIIIYNCSSFYGTPKQQEPQKSQRIALSGSIKDYKGAEEK